MSLVLLEDVNVFMVAFLPFLLFSSAFVYLYTLLICSLKGDNQGNAILKIMLKKISLHFFQTDILNNVQSQIVLYIYLSLCYDR